MDNKRIILVGSHGMLGQDMLCVLQSRSVEFSCFDRVEGEISGERVQSLDITDYDQVQGVLDLTKPDYVINCAAYTAVDKAEKEFKEAFAVNSQGTANLGTASADHGASLIHISTDYVFGGANVSEIQKRQGFTEEDTPSPCGVYGESKFEGEERLREVLPHSHLIVRTSWLHGIYGNNFVHTMLKLGSEFEELKVVDDQIGAPTFAGWLANCLWKLIDLGAQGTFHACSRGMISWKEFAEEIFSQAGLSVRVFPQTTEELGRPAPRPAFSVLSVNKLENTLECKSLSWKESVASHLQALREYRKADQNNNSRPY